MNWNMVFFLPQSANENFLKIHWKCNISRYSVSSVLGKYCMNLVDTDRSLYAQEHGYKTSLCSLKPLSCTPKNNLIIGYRDNQECQR